MPNLLHRLKISEVSSVKRGAGEGVKVVLMKIDREDEPYWKRDFSQKQRNDAAKTGAAMPDGSFPIHNEEDLHNAIRLAGNASSPAAARKHIQARAASMGMSDAIPDTWVKKMFVFDGDGDDQLSVMFKLAIDHGAPIHMVGAAEVAMNRAVEAIEKASTGDDAQADAIAKSLGQCIGHLSGLVPKDKADDYQAAVAALTKESDMTEAERAAMAKLEKSIGDMATANAAMLKQLAVLNSTPDEQAYIKAFPLADEALDKFLALKADERAAHMKAYSAGKKKQPPNDGTDDADTGDDDMGKMAKAIAESPIVKQLALENAEFKKAAKVASYKKQALDMGMLESFGETLCKAYEDRDPEAIKKVNETITGLAKQAATGEIFKEFGRGGTEGAGVTAYDQIKVKGEELRKVDPKLSPQQARVKVLMDPANQELAQRHKAEEAARRRAA